MGSNRFPSFGFSGGADICAVRETCSRRKSWKLLEKKDSRLMYTDGHSGSKIETRIRELDGWRAFSVILVVLHHLAGFQHHRVVSRLAPLDHVIRFAGPLGVDIFFVISGFVICRIFINEEQNYGTVSLRAFYCRRLFRILPPFYLYIGTLSILLASGLIEERASGILGSGLFLRDIHLKSLETVWFAGHAWSLAVEEQFYLFFPLIWTLTPGKRRGLFFFIMILMCAIWNLSIIDNRVEPIITSSTRTGFGCIAVGVLMAIYEDRVRAAARAIPAALVSVVGISLVTHPVYSNTLISALYEGLLLPLGICVLLAFSLVRGEWLRALLTSPPLQALGLTSYGIYLWQQLFTAPANYFTTSGHVILLLWPLAFIIVPLSYFFIEKPAMRYGRLLSRRLKAL